jgi:hypothetical protein
VASFIANNDANISRISLTARRSCTGNLCTQCRKCVGVGLQFLTKPQRVGILVAPLLAKFEREEDEHQQDDYYENLL